MVFLQLSPTVDGWARWGVKGSVHVRRKNHTKGRKCFWIRQICPSELSRVLWAVISSFYSSAFSLSCHSLQIFLAHAFSFLGISARFSPLVFSIQRSIHPLITVFPFYTYHFPSALSPPSGEPLPVVAFPSNFSFPSREKFSSSAFL